MERSPLRAWFAAVGVGMLLLVVAVSATEVPGRRPTASFFSVDAESVARLVVPVIQFVFLMLFVGALYWWLHTRPIRRRGRGRRRPPSPVVVLLALVIAVAWAVVVGPNLLGDETAVPTTTAAVGTALPGTLNSSGDDVAPLGRPDWGLWVLVILGMGAVGYVIVSRRQIARPSSRPVPVVGEAPSVPQPRGATDPAGRVFAAYLRVEEASSRNALSRSPAETVGSHLGRIGPVSEAASAADLAVIYHQARFSTHQIAEESAEAAEDDGRRIILGLDE